MSIQFLQFVFEREGIKPESLSSDWEKRNGRKEELEMLLDRFQLRAVTNRNKFFWDLQHTAEEVLADDVYPDHDTLISHVSEKWNAKFPEITITPEVAHHFMQYFHFKFPNNQKAFRAICDGDIEAYMMFDKDPIMFLNMLNRLLIVEIGHYKTFKKIVSRVARKLFNMEDAEKTFNKSLMELRFMNGKGRIFFPKMNQYGATYTLGDLAFAQGMRSILKGKLAIDIDDEKQKRKEAVAAQRVENEKNAKGDHKPALETEETLSKVEEKQESLNNDVAVPDLELTGVSLQIEEEPASLQTQDDPFAILLDKELTSFKEKLVSMFQEERDAAPSPSNDFGSIAQTQVDKKYVEALEEENARLKSELAASKQQSDQVYEKTINGFIQSIAGRQANYMLSDLYQETNDPSPDNYMNTVGLLINLFSEWSMLGLEPHSFGKVPGESFEVSKEELMKHFMVTAPISSQSSDILVKLVKYGWSINGKVIVQPLVEEMKGERK